MIAVDAGDEGVLSFQMPYQVGGIGAFRDALTRTGSDVFEEGRVHEKLPNVFGFLREHLVAQELVGATLGAFRRLVRQRESESGGPTVRVLDERGNIDTAVERIREELGGFVDREAQSARVELDGFFLDAEPVEGQGGRRPARDQEMDRRRQRVDDPRQESAFVPCGERLGTVEHEVATSGIARRRRECVREVGP